MNFQEKLKGLVGYLGGTPEAESVVNSLRQQAETATKAFEESGVSYKAAGDDPAAGAATAAAPEGSDAEEAAEAPEEEAAEDQFVGDMTTEEFETFLGGILDKAVGNAVAKALAAHSAMSNVATKEEIGAVRADLENVRAEIAAPVAAATKAAGELTALNSSVGQVIDRLAKAEKNITGLVGDAPRNVQGYIASQSIETVVVDQTLKSGPVGDEMDEIANKIAPMYGG